MPYLKHQETSGIIPHNEKGTFVLVLGFCVINFGPWVLSEEEGSSWKLIPTGKHVLIHLYKKVWKQKMLQDRTLSFTASKWAFGWSNEGFGVASCLPPPTFWQTAQTVVTHWTCLVRRASWHDKKQEVWGSGPGAFCWFSAQRPWKEDLNKKCGSPESLNRLSDRVKRCLFMKHGIRKLVSTSLRSCEVSDKNQNPCLAEKRNFSTVFLK